MKNKTTNFPNVVMRPTRKSHLHIAIFALLSLAPRKLRASACDAAEPRFVAKKTCDDGELVRVEEVKAEVGVSEGCRHILFDVEEDDEKGEMSFLDSTSNFFADYDYILVREYDDRWSEIGKRRMRIEDLNSDAIVYSSADRNVSHVMIAVYFDLRLKPKRNFRLFFERRCDQPKVHDIFVRAGDTLRIACQHPNPRLSRMMVSSSGKIKLDERHSFQVVANVSKEVFFYMCVFKTCSARGASLPCAVNPYATREVFAARTVGAEMSCESLAPGGRDWAPSGGAAGSAAARAAMIVAGEDIYSFRCSLEGAAPEGALEWRKNERAFPSKAWQEDNKWYRIAEYRHKKQSSSSSSLPSFSCGLSSSMKSRFKFARNEEPDECHVTFGGGGGGGGRGMEMKDAMAWAKVNEELNQRRSGYGDWRDSSWLIFLLVVAVIVVVIVVVFCVVHLIRRQRSSGNGGRCGRGSGGRGGRRSGAAPLVDEEEETPESNGFAIIPSPSTTDACQRLSKVYSLISMEPKPNAEDKRATKSEIDEDSIEETKEQSSSSTSAEKEKKKKEEENRRYKEINGKKRRKRERFWRRILGGGEGEREGEREREGDISINNYDYLTRIDAVEISAGSPEEAESDVARADSNPDGTPENESEESARPDKSARPAHKYARVQKISSPTPNRIRISPPSPLEDWEESLPLPPPPPPAPPMAPFLAETPLPSPPPTPTVPSRAATPPAAPPPPPIRLTPPTPSSTASSSASSTLVKDVASLAPPPLPFSRTKALLTPQPTPQPAPADAALQPTAVDSALPPIQCKVLKKKKKDPKREIVYVEAEKIMRSAEINGSRGKNEYLEGFHSEAPRVEEKKEDEDEEIPKQNVRRRIREINRMNKNLNNNNNNNNNNYPGYKPELKSKEEAKKKLADRNLKIENEEREREEGEREKEREEKMEKEEKRNEKKGERERRKESSGSKNTSKSTSRSESRRASEVGKEGEVVFVRISSLKGSNVKNESRSSSPEDNDSDDSDSDDQSNASISGQSASTVRPYFMSTLERKKFADDRIESELKTNSGAENRRSSIEGQNGAFRLDASRSNSFRSGGGDGGGSSANPSADDAASNPDFLKSLNEINECIRSVFGATDAAETAPDDAAAAAGRVVTGRGVKEEQRRVTGKKEGVVTCSQKTTDI